MYITRFLFLCSNSGYTKHTLAVVLSSARMNLFSRTHTEKKVLWTSPVSSGQLITQLLTSLICFKGNPIYGTNGIPCSVYHRYGSATTVLLQEGLTSHKCVCMKVARHSSVSWSLNAKVPWKVTSCLLGNRKL